MSSFYEFFAGGGMVRAGLGSGWECLFANDFDQKKSQAYRKNWGEGTIRTADVGSLTTSELPGDPDMVWASFPCQDLSLAGAGAGLKGERSGSFWSFWALMSGLIDEGRAPALMVLENVCGMLTAQNGRDFAKICSAFDKAGYRCGALVIDAALFVPQSRPRLFIIGFLSNHAVPEHLECDGPTMTWHSRALQTVYAGLLPELQRNWIWWNPPLPPERNSRFADLIEDEPTSVSWHTRAETDRLLEMMSDVNRKKVEEAKGTGCRTIGTLYKRRREEENGVRVQRAEVRFDDIAGCLRTPTGGSSRQLIMLVDGNTVRSRLISSRETARLMGLSDDYELPANYNEAYQLTGDGVVVPVVRHLARYLFDPLLEAQKRTQNGNTSATAYGQNS